MSRGTAMSMKNIGRFFRMRMTSSMSARVRMKRGEPVEERTMSARFKWTARSSNRTGVPSKSEASRTARSKVRLVTRSPRAPAESRWRAASSLISPAPMSITVLSDRSPRIFFASSTAA